ncbi:MAG: hypothetical protein LPK45_00055, partial [Bacteroidota bacterium]|nr:hypothetical protein [Bacteroidota bacterium]MDX5429413.1 hypothetical protein [Bacteroidota bacterium]MDX5468204.1 hypothetical protein [Bacteroidota bacterium]
GVRQEWYAGEVFVDTSIQDLCGGDDLTKIERCVWNYQGNTLYVLLYFTNQSYRYLEINAETYEIKNIPFDLSVLPGPGSDRHYVCSDGSIISGLQRNFTSPSDVSISHITALGVNQISLPEFAKTKQGENYSLHAQFDALYIAYNVGGSLRIYRKRLR